MLARGIRKMIHLLKFESGLAADQDLAMDPPHREPEKELISELGPMEFSFLGEWKRNLFVSEKDCLGHPWIQN